MSDNPLSVASGRRVPSDGQAPRRRARATTAGAPSIDAARARSVRNGGRREDPPAAAPDAADGASTASWFERAFVVFALTIQAGGFVPIPRLLLGIESPLEINGRLVDLGESNPLNFAFVGASFAVVAILILRRIEPVLRTAQRNWIAMILTAVVIMSTIWSLDPGLTLRRSGAYTISVVVALYIASRFSFTEIMRLIGYTTAICAVGSILFTLAAPDKGLMVYPGLEGNLRGVFAHKNGLARVMMVGILAHMYLGLFTKSRLAWCWVGLEVLLLLLARSVTGALGALVVAASVAIYMVWRMHRPLAAAATGIVGAALLALVIGITSEIDWVLGAVGKDLTLTGRTQLWSEVLTLIGQRPFLGWGYMSFFQIDNDMAVQLWTQLRWNPPHSHNGLLEVWLDLGPLGLMLVLALFVQAVIVLINCVRSGAHQEAWGFLTFTIVCLVVNLAEPTIIRNQEISTILFNVMLFSCSGIGLVPLAAKRRRAGTVSVLERARPRSPAGAVINKGAPTEPVGRPA